MAEEEEPSRPFLVMGDIVHDLRLVDFPEDWASVDCRRREAYGCGVNGDRIVNGLTLFMRAGPDDDPDLYPRLCIRATDQVYRCVGSEIDDEMAEIYGRAIRLFGNVYSVAGDVMVICVSFLARHDSAAFRSYYLVYDSAAAALFLLPRRPDDCQPMCTTFPLKVGEDKYSLVLMAERSIPGGCTQPVLLTWSPPPAASPDSRWNCKLDTTCPWILKPRARENADRFSASVVFLWKGSAVWGDLGQGILYCDCGDLIHGPGPADFKCNMLPSECRDSDDTDYADQAPKHVYRSMGCVGDSIWFVIIESSYDNPGETMVKVWTLDRLSEEEKWNPHREFKMQAIWRLDGFREKGLPETAVPKYPMFRQQDDGVLYVLLPEPYPYTAGGAYAHLVGIDFSSSCDVMHLVANRRLSIPWMHRPVFLDPYFFRRSRQN
ncbi:hypothetical protein ACQ4PT_030838 [Festuca glaucescens]